MKNLILVVAGLLALCPGPVSAQETARERAREQLPTQVFERVDALATEIGDEGIPSGPIFNKALEGMAKRVPPDRLLPAVTQFAGQLRQAREAFGMTGDGPLLVAGADALQRGVGMDLLRRLGQTEEDSPGPSPMAVLVLADLVEAGVPGDRALGMVREALRLRAGDQQMLGISAQVRQMMRQGQSPQDAVEQVQRALRRGRGGGVGPPVPPGSEPVTKARRQGGNGRGGGI